MEKSISQFVNLAMRQWGSFQSKVVFRVSRKHAVKWALIGVCLGSAMGVLGIDYGCCRCLVRRKLLDDIRKPLFYSFSSFPFLAFTYWLIDKLPNWLIQTTALLAAASGLL